MHEDDFTAENIETIEAGLIENPYVHWHITTERSPGGGRAAAAAAGDYLRRFSHVPAERRASPRKNYNGPDGDLAGQAQIPGIEAKTGKTERRQRPEAAARYAERSEKLKRIADTAFYDARAEMENQITFPQAGDTGNSGRTGKVVITPGELTEEIVGNEKNDGFRVKLSGFLQRLRRAGKAVSISDRPADVVCDSPDDLPSAIRFYADRKHRIVIKIAVLAGLLALSVIITVLHIISQKSSGFISTELYAVINLVLLALTAAFCVFDLKNGVVAIRSGGITYEAGLPLIFVSALIGTAAMFFSPSNADGAGLLPITTSFSMLLYSFGESMWNEHAVRSLKHAQKGESTLLKQALRPGIEATMSSQYAKDGYVAFASKTRFITNIATDISNAVPDSPRLRTINIIFALIAALGGIISGLYASSFAAGATVAGALFAAGMPVFSRLVPVSALISENASLRKKGGYIYSYSDAQSNGTTGAYALNQSFFIDPKSSIIHDVRAVVPESESSCLALCAVAMRECGSPFASSAAALAHRDLDSLKPAHGAEYYDDGCIVNFNGHRLFLGSEKLLSDNAVNIPSDVDYFDIIAGDRRLLFFAIDKQLALILSVSYHFRQNARKCVSELVNSGRRIVSASFDPNVDTETISGRCRVGSDKVSRMRIEESIYIYNEAQRIHSKGSSAPVWDGTAAGLAAIVRSCRRLLKVNSVSLISGAVISLLLCAGIFVLSLLSGTTAASLAVPAALIAGRLLQAAAVKVFS
ncbi:MAG: hypothetical protein K6G90_02880 [Clostridia bacterium]|nr:hypothetical protein [Clostridia bacterium]